jgi:alkanesulfonate monooxygenase SsuD/methylene tetrahydromethanopterin reductase-like flavin-dependent oxidoreductase (luciferase family)
VAVGLMLKDPPCELVERVAPVAERQGCTHLLFPELSILGGDLITGRDPFVSASIALKATTTLRSGPAVVGTVFHTPRHLALRAATVHEQSGGRFLLGCGVSHQGFASELGIPFPASPLSHVRDYCDTLRAVSRRLAFGDGFPIWLAALGDRMVETAADVADGVILNWVSPAWLQRTSDLARQRAPGPFTVAVLVRVGPREVLEDSAARYVDMFEHYAQHFSRQGLRRPSDVVEHTCIALDDLAALPDRVLAYREAGADLVGVYPADLEPDAVMQVVGHIQDWE